MPSSIESLKSMTLSGLKKYAKALRAKIKEKKGSESGEKDAKDFIEELDLVKSTISDKEIEEANLTMIRNHVVEVLKKTKP